VKLVVKEEGNFDGDGGHLLAVVVVWLSNRGLLSIQNRYEVSHQT
jgi:hypothetical protein